MFPCFLGLVGRKIGNFLSKSRSQGVNVAENQLVGGEFDSPTSDSGGLGV